MPGFELARSVRNLTDPARTGSEAAPWKTGDSILVSYQLDFAQAQSHLEIEDQLPACLETVNPDLPPIAENFKLPIDAGVNTLKLAHVELRFARTLLYFDRGQPGRNLYAVLAAGHRARHFPMARDPGATHLRQPIFRYLHSRSRPCGVRPRRCERRVSAACCSA